VAVWLVGEHHVVAVDHGVFDGGASAAYAGLR
jgi:hypothetical protein